MSGPSDAQLIRGVRLRLVAWSGVTTLVVLVVLGVALYARAATELRDAGERQLTTRADEIVGFLRDPRGRPGGPEFGFRFGGSSSGTFATFVDGDGRPIGPAPAPPDGLPDRASIAAAAVAASGRDIATATVGDVPVRVLTVEVQRRLAGPAYLQVVGDRTAEVRTLGAIVNVLAVGGLVVVLVALGFGALYAERALVPIRAALAGQRAALRRQREFAADASHELRTPLTVIRSSVDLLRRHAAQRAPDVRESVDDIDAEVSHLTALVDDLLLLARSDSGAVTVERRTLDVGDLAADAAASLVPAAAARGVAILVDPVPAPLEGDPDKLRRLVLILLDNAIRHSPRGGTVRVRVRAEPRRVTLDVEDDGPGVRPEDMPRVFERFWRAPGAPGGGTGLGLAIAASIVDLHGGTIAVTNRPGACFGVSLPRGDSQDRLRNEPDARGRSVPQDREVASFGGPSHD